MKLKTLFNYPIQALGFDLLLMKFQWRRENKHNKTLPVNKFNRNAVRVGLESYGPLEVHMWNADCEKLEIGNYVSISHGVKFILGGNHHATTFTTFPLKALIWKHKQPEAISKGPIKVQDDVWIGTDAIILSGITLGQGCIIGAGSIVTKSVPPYSIVAGNPARILKYRFPEHLIAQILKIDLMKAMTLSSAKAKALLYSDVSEQTLREIEELIKMDFK